MTWNKHKKKALLRKFCSLHRDGASCHINQTLLNYGIFPPLWGHFNMCVYLCSICVCRGMHDCVFLLFLETMHSCLFCRGSSVAWQPSPFIKPPLASVYANLSWGQRWSRFACCQPSLTSACHVFKCMLIQLDIKDVTQSQEGQSVWNVGSW